MNLTLNHLEKSFNKAIKDNMAYVGVLIAMKDLNRVELIINPRQNFEKKLRYYKGAYNKDLTLKANNEIRIVGIAFSNHLSALEHELLLKRNLIPRVIDIKSEVEDANPIKKILEELEEIESKLCGLKLNRGEIANIRHRLVVIDEILKAMKLYAGR